MVYNQELMAYREQYTQELDMNDTEDISDTIKYETISAKLLEKDIFTKTEENRKRIQNLGFIKIGEVEFIDYDADNEIAYIKLHQSTVDNLIYEYLFEGLTLSIGIKPLEAKKLFSDTSAHSLLIWLHYEAPLKIYLDLGAKVKIFRKGIVKR